jgi:ABC-type nitrate/sulfonate/bicarbonate transport system substrate-binding protein
MRSRFGSVLASTALVVGTLVAGSTSWAAEKTNFALNWVPGPQHTEFVVAKYNGYFEKNGLDVDMHAPAASTDPIKLVASGNDQFGIAYAGDVIQARAQGVPVVAVAVIHRKIPLGLISKPDAGIKEPKDLLGKTIGLTPVPNNRAMFWDFVKRTGLDKDKLKVVTVQFNGPQVVAAGKADAADAVNFYEIGVYKQVTGQQPAFMNFTDFGVPDGYFFTIITSEANLKKNPDSVRRFVDAVLQSEKWTVEHPDDARKVLLSNVKEVTEEFAKQSRQAIDAMVTDSDTQAHGVGWNSPKVWETMAAWYAEQGLTKTKVNAADCFSNEFLPKEPVQISRK